MTQLKVAIVGVGRWGVHLLRNFLQHPQAQVLAVVDHNRECLRAVKQKYDLSESVKLTTDWQQLQNLPNLQAVVIATPAVTHYPLIMDALTWGYHVLAEKPLTLNPPECRLLCQLAKKRHLQLMVDHTYLFHPAVEKGQAILQTGILGDLRYGYATRTHLGPVRQDVDALWDLAIHDIAIFNTWLGQSPVKVQATGTVWLQERGTGGRGDGGTGGHGDIQPLADLIWATLTYPDGFQAVIHLCWLNPDKQRRLGVVGTRGSLIFDEMSYDAPLTRLEGEFEVVGDKFIPVNQKRVVVELEKVEPLAQMCDRFIYSVVKNTPSPNSSGWVGTELVEILTMLTQSLQQGGKPVFIN